VNSLQVRNVRKEGDSKITILVKCTLIDRDGLESSEPPTSLPSIGFYELG